MTKELTVKKDIAKEHELSVIERVVMQGDLSKLDPNQRVTYYNKVCESLGLNPYTRPFAYISLNGQLQLYAKKDATEQLRSVKNISITELDGKIIDDLYIVKAKASMPNGRVDQSTGAVTIGNLKGESKANAIMKAETKAKRRVTLSISGLGWVDESEIDSIPNAKRVNVDMDTGEVIDIPNAQIEHTPPPAQTAPPAPPQAPVVPNTMEKSPGYDAFVLKHQIVNGKLKWVQKIAHETKRTEIQTINAAMLTEERFVKAYNMFIEQERKKAQQQVHSMDELVEAAM